MTSTQRRTVAFSANATNVFFHILTRCNLSCRHCYINAGQHGTRTLPLKTIVDWLGVFSAKASRANLVFLGGEPTLHPDLPEAIRAARQMGFASVTVDTNGYLFHDVLARVLPDDLDFISFSLDGATASTNDRIRGPGTYDRCLQGVRAAVARGFSCSMIYTVSAANLHELKEMVPLAASLGIRRFFIQVIGIRGRSAGSGNPSGQVSAHQWLGHVPDVAEAMAAEGITATFPKVFLSENEPFECAGIVADNYFIFPNGRVYRCPLCEDFPLHGFRLEAGGMVQTPPINETDLFGLRIPEGCVMNRLIQPGNLSYRPDGTPEHRIACCLLKEEIAAARRQ